MFLLVNSSVHLHFLHIVPVPRWALIAVAVAVAILFLLFLICIIKCCCCKKKPKKKERVGLLAVSSSTAANLVRPAFTSHWEVWCQAAWFCCWWDHSRAGMWLSTC